MKRFLLASSIAIVLPLLVHYGVGTFWQPPQDGQYRIEDYEKKYEKASPAEKARLEQEKKELDARRDEAEMRFRRNLFRIAYPIGLAGVAIGIFIRTVGTGLMIGGILSLLDGYVGRWAGLDYRARFISLAIAFIVLVAVGIKKFGRS